MALVFYPSLDEAFSRGTMAERMELLLDGAERYKAIMLEEKASHSGEAVKSLVPRDLPAAFNWEEIARVLREIRELPEATNADKAKKCECFTKLAEVYEVLRAAKLSKLEAVRLALISEANHLRGSSQVA
jgi:hypothetical protein